MTFQGKSLFPLMFLSKHPIPPISFTCWTLAHHLTIRRTLNSVAPLRLESLSVDQCRVEGDKKTDRIKTECKPCGICYFIWDHREAQRREKANGAVVVGSGKLLEMRLWPIRWFGWLCEFDLCDPLNDYDVMRLLIPSHSALAQHRNWIAASVAFIFSCGKSILVGFRLVKFTHYWSGGEEKGGNVGNGDTYFYILPAILFGCCLDYEVPFQLFVPRVHCFAFGITLYLLRSTVMPVCGQLFPL